MHELVNVVTDHVDARYVYKREDHFFHVSPGGNAVGAFMFVTQLHIMPRLRLSGVLPLRPFCASNGMLGSGLYLYLMLKLPYLKVTYNNLKS